MNAADEIRRIVALVAALRQDGRAGEAALMLRRALDIDSDDAGALQLAGIAACELRDFETGATLFGRAVLAAPHDATPHYNLGNAQLALGRYDDAAASFRCAVDLRPGFADAHGNLGNLLGLQDRIDEALAAYERALASDPDSLSARYNLAALLQRVNRPAEAYDHACDGLRRQPADPGLNLIAARCERRAGRPADAIARLAVLDLDRLAPIHRRAIHFELGRSFDEIDDADNAMVNFIAGNRFAAAALAGHWSKGRFREQVNRLTAQFNSPWVAGWQPAAGRDDGTPPAFLLGFPRSGTTMLELALDGHPDVQSLDEKSTVKPVRDAIAQLADGYPAALADLGAAEQLAMRRLYRHAVRQALGGAPVGRVVDKNPYHTLSVGLIHRLFPDAKLILALRHPCDVCLSCFMQDFSPSHASANFTTLADAAALYASVMALWQRYQETLALDCHPLRYEHLIDDFAGELRRVLDFLDLDWHAGVLAFQARALARIKVGTASYSQVAEPLYRRARYRWRRYAKYMGEIESTLRPFIERFGYAG